MATLFDYLQWRGDLTFTQDPPNAVDALIFSTLSYIRYGTQAEAHPEQPVLLRTAAEAFFTREEPEKDVRVEKDLDLLHDAALTTRFGQTRITMYRDILIPEQETQFAAVTFLLDDGSMFLAFRGTDYSLVGWKEDFNLSFISPIPAQAEAKEYLDSVGTVLGCPLRVGGHSKGGNLAVYASAHANESIRALITAVYNNDGPGQDEKTVLSDGYKEISGRIRTFLPKSSVVGMLLEYSRDFYVVDSDARGIFQHNPYTWLTEDDSFSYVSSTTLFSMHLSSTIRIWLKGLSSEERKRIIDIVFDVLEAGNVRTLGEIKSNAAAMIRVFRFSFFITSNRRQFRAANIQQRPLAF